MNYERFKKHYCFMIDHGLKATTRYCEHDDRFEMTFTKKDGEKVNFVSTRAAVEERYGKADKLKTVENFEDMAMEWYSEFEYEMQNMQ